MKKIRVLSVVLALVLVTLMMSSCDQFKALSDIISSARTDSVLTGTDYITYRNTNRDKIMEAYVGKKVDSTKSELLLDNIELTYSKLEGDETEYEIFIENSNKSYFYNGVVTLRGELKEIKINVRMLAPECYEYFTIDFLGSLDDNEYFVEGDIYESKKEVEIDYVYWLDYEGLGVSESWAIIDAPKITEELANEFAQYFYDLDAVYNYTYDVTYYLLTEDDYEAGEAESVYALVTNTEEQEMILIITEPGMSPVEKILTFSK